MIEINEKIIKKQAGAVIFDRGNQLYLNNYVKDLKVETEKGSTLKVLEGAVYSYEERKDLKVEVLLGMKTEAIEFECECMDYKNSSKKKACKHIVAVLLRYLKGQPKVVQMEFDMQLETPKAAALPKEEEKVVEEAAVIKETEVKTNTAPKQKQTPKLSPKKVLNVDVIFNYFCLRGLKTVSIELKIGEKNTYKINDIKAFFLALKHKKALEISSEFSLRPEKHAFKKADIALIKLIAASNKYGRDKYEDGKIYLQEEEIKNFFEIVKDKAIDLVINNKIYKNIKILTSDMPLEFEIKKEKDKVVLKQLNEMPLALTDSNEYYFFKRQLYKPGSVQAYRYSPLYEEFVKNNTQTIIYTEDIEKIYDLLCFKLKDISKHLKVMNEPKGNIEAPPLNAHIQLEMNSRGVLARPKFIYGDVEIDPFSERKYIESSKFTKREVDTERKIIEMIRSFNFLHSKDGFILNFENINGVVRFIKTGVKSLEQIATVHYGDELKNIKVYEAEDYKPEVYFFNNYLEFSLNIDDVSYTDIRNIFDALKDYENYCRLQNGSFVSLKNKELIRISQIIGERTIENKSAIKGRFTVSRKISLLTGRVYHRKINYTEEIERKKKENEKLYEEKNLKLKEILTNINKVDEKEFIVPSRLAGIMRGYQKTGFKWFKTLSLQNLGGILADEMGLGKTLQAIALIVEQSEKTTEAKKPSIVVAPTSLIYNWENEIQKFAPELRTIVIYGTQKERRSLREDLENMDVVITSYGIIAKDIDEYANIDFKYCFIDEAQQIKNPKTQASKAVKLINAEARFALTGTPIENSLSELWSIFDFIMPGYLLSNRSFKEHYEMPILNYHDKNALESLNNIIQPFILRRLKKDVLFELPDKIEQQIIVEMTEEQKEVYKSSLIYSKESIDEEINSKGFNKSQIHIFSALTKLRQICCHPSIVIPDYPGESGKMLALDSIVQESILNNHRILIFSQFVSVLQLLKTRLEDNNIKCLYLDGSTKSRERIRLVEEFNSGHGDVFLISLKAGGFGLNLTGADVVIHFDPWWNPAAEEQATDRAHRIGQIKNVEVIKLVTKNTIEERILKLQSKKKAIANSVIADKDSENSFITKLTKEEIEELFRMS